jgi:serine/threonine-protein kinase
MDLPALVGTVLDGKFQIEKALASGAAGDVYEALHLNLGSRVAVKVLRPGIPETADIRRKRFMREARVAARLQSDHVVRVFDVVAPEKGPTYIVMELLRGETLAERLRREGALSVAEAVDLVLQAAKPLGEMHAEGIIHRDVKPSNLFLARDADGKERIKLLDFGVAAFQQPVPRGAGDSSITLSAAIVGTPRYMAPEQVMSSRAVDARADVWALGVTLYELLAGRPPFDGQTVLAVLNQIEHQQPPRLDDQRPGIPHALAALVHSCLAKDPAMRPADGRALVESLSLITSSAVSSTRDDPDSTRELMPPVVLAPARRRTAIVAAGVGGGLVLAALAALALRPPEPVGRPLIAATSAPAAVVTTAPPPAEPPAPPPPPSPRAARSETAASDRAAPRDNTTARATAPARGAPPPAARPVTKPPPRPAPQRAVRPDDDDRIE